jgi:membrane protease YdiL (CAAX protease family)
LIFGGGLEEIGWRGILQPYLETFHSFITSTIIVAVIWSVWHLPLWFIRGAAQCGRNYIIFCVIVLGLSFSLAVIRRFTNNVFLCILFHSCIDSFSTVFNLQQGLSTIITTVVEVVLALFIIQALSKVRKQKKLDVYENINI